MNQMQAQAMERVGEVAGPIFRTPCSVGSGEATIFIDFKQATDLLAMFGGEPNEITLQIGDGHSGRGLYASYTDMPEEGAIFLGISDQEAVPDVATSCSTCNDHGMIGGPSFYEPGEGGVPCPDCAAIAAATEGAAS